MNARAIAISLANSGFRVFPCSAKKRPTIPRVERDDGTVWPGGVYGASNNEQVIDRHFHEFWGPLVAYATGQPSDIDVLDFDDKHGGLGTFDAILSKLPRTFIYRTGGNGGLHIQFRHHPSMRIIPQGAFPLKGGEVKSTGGYAIAWWAHGSQVIDDSAPAPWPGWLLDLARRPDPPPLVERVRGRAECSPSRRFAGVIARVEAAANGNRHGLIFWGGVIAGQMAALREIDDLHGAIEEVALAGVRAGKHPKEARRTALDGARAGLRHA
jgi:Bifunctional DNA primase/polymerase, N-terminal